MRDDSPPHDRGVGGKLTNQSPVISAIVISDLPKVQGTRWLAMRVWVYRPLKGIRISDMSLKKDVQTLVGSVQRWAF